MGTNDTRGRGVGRALDECALSWLVSRGTQRFSSTLFAGYTQAEESSGIAPGYFTTVLTTTRTADLAQCFVYSLSRVAAHRGHPVRVPIQRQLYGSVPQGLLHIRWMRALNKQQRGVGVPQIVPAYIASPALTGFEVTVDCVLGVQGGADGSGEDEAVLGSLSASLKLCFTYCPFRRF
jgi:hypothetical protein